MKMAKSIIARGVIHEREFEAVFTFEIPFLAELADYLPLSVNTNNLKIKPS